jgi:integrase
MKLRGLYRKTDTGIYYYQPPMARGVRPKPISLGTKDLEEATAAYWRAVAETRDEFRRGSLRMESARFLRERLDAGHHTAQSSQETERVIRRTIEALGNREVHLYGEADFRRLRDQWGADGLSPATVVAYLARLGAFFRWAQGEGLCQANPLATMRHPRTLPTRSEKYCTRDERERLIAALPPDRLDLALVLWLGFFAGLRRLEIDQARRDWVDLGAGVLSVRVTETFRPKNKRGRAIRLSPRLAEFLARYLEQVPGEPGDFLLRPDKKMGRKQRTRGRQANRYRYDARRPFRLHMERCGLAWVGFHTMRHTFATLHALAGTPLTTLARELGDEVQTVFAHYVGYQRSSTHSAAVD